MKYKHGTAVQRRCQLARCTFLARAWPEVACKHPGQPGVETPIMRLSCQTIYIWQATLTSSLRFSLLGLGRAVGIRLAEVWQVVLLVNLSLQVQQIA